MSHKNTRFSVRVDNRSFIAKYQDGVGATCRSSVDPVDAKGEGGKWGEVLLMPHVYNTHTHTHTHGLLLKKERPVF